MKTRTSCAPEGTSAEITASGVDSPIEAPTAQEATSESGAPQLDVRQAATSPIDADAAPGEAHGAARIDEIAREAGLTPREAEVFALLAQGRSIPYIRDELIISRETAATHAKHIYAKLGVHSRQELIDLVRR
nr:helix-turn-helix transcriptional regulator [Adlercreutzia equolifaciens]